MKQKRKYSGEEAAIFRSGWMLPRKRARQVQAWVITSFRLYRRRECDVYICPVETDERSQGRFNGSDLPEPDGAQCATFNNRLWLGCCHYGSKQISLENSLFRDEQPSYKPAHEGGHATKYC